MWFSFPKNRLDAQRYLFLWKSIKKPTNLLHHLAPPSPRLSHVYSTCLLFAQSLSSCCLICRRVYRQHTQPKKGGYFEISSNANAENCHKNMLLRVNEFLQHISTCFPLSRPDSVYKCCVPYVLGQISAQLVSLFSLFSRLNLTTQSCPGIVENLSELSKCQFWNFWNISIGSWDKKSHKLANLGFSIWTEKPCKILSFSPFPRTNSQDTAKPF